MLKTTVKNLRNQCVYKATAQDILYALGIAVIFIAVAILEGGIM